MICYQVEGTDSAPEFTECQQEIASEPYRMTSMALVERDADVIRFKVLRHCEIGLCGYPWHIGQGYQYAIPVAD